MSLLNSFNVNPFLSWKLFIKFLFSKCCGAHTVYYFPGTMWCSIVATVGNNIFLFFCHHLCCRIDYKTDELNISILDTKLATTHWPGIFQPTSSPKLHKGRFPCDIKQPHLLLKMAPSSVTHHVKVDVNINFYLVYHWWWCHLQ